MGYPLDGVVRPTEFLSNAELCLDFLKTTATFSTCRFHLRSAADLDTVREELLESGYGWILHPGENRTALLLRDAAFLSTAKVLARNLRLGSIIFPVIYGLVLVLGFLVSWLMIHGRKQEFSIMRGLGAKKSRIFASFFLEQAIYVLLGCAAGCLLIPVMRFGLVEPLPLFAYLVSYLGGCAVSVVFGMKKKLMDIIRERD